MADGRMQGSALSLTRHAELGLAPIVPQTRSALAGTILEQGRSRTDGSALAEEWALKQVQGDHFGRKGRG